MADGPVSGYPPKTALAGTEEVYINDAGTSKKVTVTNLINTGKSRYRVTGYFYNTSGSDRVMGFNRDTHVAISAEDSQRFYVPRAGTVKQLSVYISANGDAADRDYKIRKNGTAEASPIITVTASTTGLFEDTSGSFTVADGDYLTFQMPGVLAAQTGSISVEIEEDLI